MIPESWHRFEHELPFRLGEMTLGHARVKVLRKVHRLAEIRNFSAVADLPPLEGDLAGYLLVSIPQATNAASREATGFIHYRLKAYTHSFIEMSSQDFAAYQGKFSSKTRSGINRKVRKFEQNAGGLDFRRYASAESMEEFYGHARAVSGRSYQERLLDCGLPSDPAFIQELKAAASRDVVRAFLLFAHGEPVSYLYCPSADGVLLYSHLGYVQEFASLSVGTVLHWLALESLFAERKFTAFDFTEGESEHKRQFGTHQVPCTHELLLRPTLHNRLVVTSHRVVDRLSSGLGDVLERYQLKARVRRWIRRAA